MNARSGSITITQEEMDDCINHWEVLNIMRAKGVPFRVGAMLTPHPDYEYTEHVDYDKHIITITWSKKL